MKLKEILEQPDFNVEQALYEHQQNYWKSAMKLIVFLASVQQTLHHYKGDKHVRSAKFEAFKQQKFKKTKKNMVKRFGKNMATKRLNKPTKIFKLDGKDMQAMQNVEKIYFLS